jgi:4-hydroxybenzoate polyprenyltransferase
MRWISSLHVGATPIADSSKILLMSIKPEILPPLCVDLDGTLSRSDTLMDAIVLLFSRSPILIIQVFLSIFSGKAAFKGAVAKAIDWQHFRFCWNESVMQYIKQESAKGREVILATGAHAAIAEQVVEKFPCFSGFVATSADENLTGKRKAAALVQRFGSKSFDYIGNDKVDIPVWRAARKAVLVNCDKSIYQQLERESIDYEVLLEKEGALASLLRALRPHQWVKNILVFFPLCAAHMFVDAVAWGNALLMFVAYCLTASSFYVFNDMMDIHADREHPKKYERPFASGALSPLFGIFYFLVLLASGLAAASVIPGQGALLSLLCYIVLNASYTIWIKSSVLLDVIVLGLLYMIRIISGGLAVGATPSSWLLAFSAFLFLSLGLVKRYSELVLKQDSGIEKVAGRGYKPSDSTFVFMLGLTNGLLATLVLAFYVNSDSAFQLYTNPYLTWAVVPAVLYWVSRIWLIAWRREMNHDPVVFAVKDMPTYLTAAFVAVFFFLAI